MRYYFTPTWNTEYLILLSFNDNRSTSGFLALRILNIFCSESWNSVLTEPVTLNTRAQEMGSVGCIFLWLQVRIS